MNSKNCCLNKWRSIQCLSGIANWNHISWAVYALATLTEKKSSQRTITTKGVISIKKIDFNTEPCKRYDEMCLTWIA